MKPQGPPSRAVRIPLSLASPGSTPKGSAGGIPARRSLFVILNRGAVKNLTRIGHHPFPRESRDALPCGHRQNGGSKLPPYEHRRTESPPPKKTRVPKGTRG